jgi:hypothetical protein
VQLPVQFSINVTAKSHVNNTRVARDTMFVFVHSCSTCVAVRLYYAACFTFTSRLFCHSPNMSWNSTE